MKLPLYIKTSIIGIFLFWLYMAYYIYESNEFDLYYFIACLTLFCISSITIVVIQQKFSGPKNIFSWLVAICIVAFDLLAFYVTLRMFFYICTTSLAAFGLCKGAYCILKASHTKQDSVQVDLQSATGSEQAIPELYNAEETLTIHINTKRPEHQGKEIKFDEFVPKTTIREHEEVVAMKEKHEFIWKPTRKTNQKSGSGCLVFLFLCLFILGGSAYILDSLISLIERAAKLKIWAGLIYAITAILLLALTGYVCYTVIKVKKKKRKRKYDFFYESLSPNTDSLAESQPTILDLSLTQAISETQESALLSDEVTPEKEGVAELQSSVEIAENQDEKSKDAAEQPLFPEAALPETVHDEPEKEELFISEDNQSCSVTEENTPTDVPLPESDVPPPKAPKFYKFPSIELLESPAQPSQENADYISHMKILMQETFSAFKLPLTVVGAEQGPVYTRFDVEVPLGFRINRIKRERENLAFSLGVEYLQIAPVPGKPSILGFTMKNPSPVTVQLSACLSSDAFQSFSAEKLPFVAGQTFSGETIIKSLTDGHLLILGGTGSGKTKLIDAMLISFMFRLSPETLKLILIDPTATGIQLYSEIPHLLIPPVTDSTSAISALHWLQWEIKRRFNMLSESNSRRILSYNEKQWEDYGDELPAIVVVIDGLAKLEKNADLIELRDALLYVLRNGMAVGIYVVASTQSLDCFSLSNDLRTLFVQKACLFTNSLEYKKLFGFAPKSKDISLGRVQFMKTGELEPVELLCPMIKDSEIESVVSYLK